MILAFSSLAPSLLSSRRSVGDAEPSPGRAASPSTTSRRAPRCVCSTRQARCRVVRGSARRTDCLSRRRRNAALDARLAALETRTCAGLAVPAGADAQEDVERGGSRCAVCCDKHGLGAHDSRGDGRPASRPASRASRAGRRHRGAREPRCHSPRARRPRDERPARREEIYRVDLAPYVDLLVVPEGSEPAVGDGSIRSIRPPRSR